MRILKYVARRLLLMLPVLFGVLLLTFVLVRVLPGDPVRALLPDEATQAEIDAVREKHGLDSPLPTQFVVYVKELAQGNFGASFQTSRPVTEELPRHLGPTFELITLAFIVALVVGTVLGLYAASRRGTARDQSIRVGSLAAGSFSEFFFGLLLVFIFYYQLGWAPVPRGRVDDAANLQSITHIDLVDAVATLNFAALPSILAHLVLPVVTLAVVMSPGIIRIVRAAAIDVLHSDAYQTAVAHGIGRRARATYYLLRPTLTSLPAFAALVYGHAIGAAVLVEVVFSWDGLGQWALQAMRTRDYPVIQVFVLVSASVYVFVFLVADVVHAVLDPRVRL